MYHVVNPDPHEREEPRQRQHGRRRKERVLHTRISEELADDIRRIADDLRVPVSNIVRNVLEETFSVVERVSDDVGDILEEVVDEAEAARKRILWRQRRQRRRRRAREQPRESRSEGEGSTRGSRPSESAPGDDPAGDVLGWQPLVLHRPQLCVLCGASLERGESAFMAVTVTVNGQGVGGKFACEACVQR
jgi:hypothetical protein